MRLPRMRRVSGGRVARQSKAERVTTPEETRATDTDAGEDKSRAVRRGKRQRCGDASPAPLGRTDDAVLVAHCQNAIRLGGRALLDDPPRTSVAITNAAAETRSRTDGKGIGRARRPGFRRLGIGGFILGLENALTLWSLFLLAVGVPAADFRLFTLQEASHPAPLAINGAPFSLWAAVALLLPLSIIGTVGGFRLWTGSPPQIALVGSFLWVVLAFGVALSGGAADLLVGQILLFAMIASGAWAGRKPGTTPLELILPARLGQRASQ
jgi:hypothetical protein